MAPKGVGTVSHWLRELIAWDGLLPAFIWTIPWVLSNLFPNRRGPVEACAVILPILGVVIRLVRGLSVIAQTSRGSWRWLTRIACFLMAISILCVLDCFVILINIMPPMPPLRDARDLAFTVAPFLVYLALVGYAFFPETTPRSDFTYPQA